MLATALGAVLERASGTGLPGAARPSGACAASKCWSRPSRPSCRAARCCFGTRPAALGPADADAAHRRPARGGGTAAGGRAAGMFDAAWRASPAIRRAGPERMLRSAFEELFNHLDPYSRYMTPGRGGGGAGRRIGQTGLGLGSRRAAAARCWSPPSPHAGRRGRAPARRPGAGGRTACRSRRRTCRRRGAAGRPGRHRGGAADRARQAALQRPPAAQHGAAGDAARAALGRISSGCSSTASPTPPTCG